MDFSKLEKLNGTEKRVVEVEIPEKDLLEAGEKASKLHSEIKGLERDKKSFNNRIKDEIDAITPEFDTLMRMICKGTIDKEVWCEKYYDKETNEICFVVEGHVVGSREATDEDKQINIDDVSPQEPLAIEAEIDYSTIRDITEAQICDNGQDTEETV